MTGRSETGLNYSRFSCNATETPASGPVPGPGPGPASGPRSDSYTGYGFGFGSVGHIPSLSDVRSTMRVDKYSIRNDSDTIFILILFRFLPAKAYQCLPFNDMLESIGKYKNVGYHILLMRDANEIE